MIFFFAFFSRLYYTIFMLFVPFFYIFMFTWINTT